MEPTRDAKPNHRRNTRDRRDIRDTGNPSPDAANADADMLCSGELVAGTRVDARSTGLLSGTEAIATPAQMTGNALAQAVEFLHATERARLRALVNADMEIADQLHADDFQLINPAGRTLSKEEYLGGIASGQIDYLFFDPTSPIDVRFHNDAAVMRYQSQIDIVVDGEHKVDRGWHTDVYELRDGRWQAVWSRMTAIQ